MFPLATLLIAQAAAASVPQHVTCEFDREAMLALDLNAFDQDMAGGWRSLAAKGCDEEVADLLRDWREVHRSSAFILTWHEGQARAMAGQTQQAIELFDQSRHPPEEDAPFGWNLYVDGSIAFLRGDRQALQSARDRLAILPRPENFSPVGTDGEVIEIAWPLNLNVLDAFLRCWGQPYKAAYFCPAPV